MDIRYEKTVLPNGVRVLSEAIAGFPTVAFGIWVNVGSRDESPQENGLTHFIEHMLFKGTESRSALEIAKEMDRLGGYSNAFTSRENTCFHAKVLPEDLPALIELMTDIFLHPRFDPEDVEREKQIVLQEIKMVEDSPEELVHELFSQFFWRGGPLGQPILGTWDTVSRFSPRDLRRYFQKLYTGSRVVVSAAGNIEHLRFLEQIRGPFGRLSPCGEECRRVSSPVQTGVKVYPKDLEQVHFVFGVPAPGATDPKRYEALLFNTLLGGNMSSRLFQEIREKRGLAYSIYSYLSLYEDRGVLWIYAAIEKKDLKETLSVVGQEIRDLMAGNIREDEFKAALDHLRSALLLSSDSPDTRMTRVARNEILFGRYIPYTETLKRLRQIRRSDLTSFAREIFSHPPALVVLGPLQEKELKLPEDFFFKI